MKHVIKRTTLLFAAMVVAFGTLTAAEQEDKQINVSSPDRRMEVEFSLESGRPMYGVKYDGKAMVERSALGVRTNAGDFTSGLAFKGNVNGRVDTTYNMRGTKASAAHYSANTMTVTLESPNKRQMKVRFNVANNDIAFRYEFPQTDDTACMVVTGEATSFKFPNQTTTFICPQSDPMIGWMRTKPSYEEEYKPDAPMTAKSAYGQGYTFPCLFRVGNDGWALVSETGTDGGYVGCHLSDYTPSGGYTVAFPMQGESNGFGSTGAAVPLPYATPWRTITIGKTLKPIVETTIPYDVVSPKYEASEKYRPGRYTWSWLIWQDNSINYADQKQFVDLAAKMGYEYVLVDGFWDKTIGRDSIAVLSRYAQSKGVSLMLWYNSNGAENNAPQTPKNCMNTAIARKKEMAWMKSIGVKGIKVDFFAGDKQHTMQLYEDILSDANDYGLQVIFHGCTLPRGWERMYPNYVASEAVLASENVFFSEHHAKREAFELTMHPFCRNAVASMDWGGVIMNTMMSRDNKSRHRRYTTNTFEMASGIINQASIQCVAMQPNNLQELSTEEIDFLKDLPSAWDETRYVDGYPGRYAVLARRHGNKWFVAGLNACDKPIKLSLELPMLTSNKVVAYEDGKDGHARKTALKKNKKGFVNVTIQPNGGLIITQ